MEIDRSRTSPTKSLEMDVANFSRVAAKTFNNIMTPARQVWALAFKMKKVPRNITLEIESRKGQKPNRDPLIMSEVLQVVQHTGEHFSAAWRNYFEVAFFYRRTAFRADRTPVESRGSCQGANPNRSGAREAPRQSHQNVQVPRCRFTSSAMSIHKARRWRLSNARGNSRLNLETTSS